MKLRRAFGLGLLAFPIVGLAIVFALSAYTGCDIQDRPFAFLGDDCVKNGVRWNDIAAPLGTLSIFWIVIGPAIWIVFLVSESLVSIAKGSRREDQSFGKE